MSFIQIIGLLCGIVAAALSFTGIIISIKGLREISAYERNRDTYQSQNKTTYTKK